MQIENYKEYSFALGRDMEFTRYGWSGKPVLGIPCQNSKHYDWENFGMIDTLSDYINSGALQIYVIDTIDGETLAGTEGDPHERAWLHECWFRYVTEEVVERIRQISCREDILVSGFSMGAYHAGNFFFRRPDLFDSVIALSGLYDTDGMYDGVKDSVIYENDPCASLSNMPEDHPYIEMFNQRRMVFCVGQGAWEEALADGTRRLEEVLRRKNIHAWVDFWGYDVNHDWPWWKKQMRYFLPYVLKR